MGWNSQNVTQLLIITGSGFTGLFVYNPTPGAGNLTESIAAVGGTDPYGNAYAAGVNVYGANSQRVGIQIGGFGPQVGFFSGAASENMPSRLYNFLFNRGLANEQIDFVISGPESTASPVDYVAESLFSSAANAAGGANGQFAYGQSAGTPAALVQTSPSGTSTGGASITLTLGAGTTAGNCVIVMINMDATSGPDPTVSGVTLGGAAGNFAQSVTSTGTGNTSVAIWADPNCTGAQTSIVVSFTGGSGTRHCSAIAQEWSGLALTAVVDQTSSNGANSGASWTSGATGGTSVAGEIAIGVVAGEGAPTFTGPGSGWTNLTQINNGTATGMLAGYESISGIGSATYSGTMSPGSGYTAAVATFKPASGATSTNLLVAEWSKVGWQGFLVAKNASTVPASSPAVAETWHNIALAGSFTAGTPTPQYMYESMNGGRVRLRGQVVTPTVGAGTTWTTLPVGYRPATGPIPFNCVTNMSGAVASVTAYAGGSISVATTGVCTIVPATTNGNVFDLDGITFPLD